MENVTTDFLKFEKEIFFNKIIALDGFMTSFSFEPHYGSLTIEP